MRRVVHGSPAHHQRPTGAAQRRHSESGHSTHPIAIRNASPYGGRLPRIVSTLGLPDLLSYSYLRPFKPAHLGTGCPCSASQRPSFSAKLRSAESPTTATPLPPLPSSVRRLAWPGAIGGVQCPLPGLAWGYRRGCIGAFAEEQNSWQPLPYGAGCPACSGAKGGLPWQTGLHWLTKP